MELSRHRKTEASTGLYQRLSGRGGLSFIWLNSIYRVILEGLCVPALTPDGKQSLRVLKVIIGEAQNLEKSAEEQDVTV